MKMEEFDTAGYTLLTLAKQPFSFVLRTGGRITVDSRDVVIITSRSSGIIKLSNDYLFPGIRISAGEVLFTISGEQLTEDNTELNFRQVKADLEQAAANYERAKQLISDKIITQSDFLAARNEYEKLRNTYENLNATSGGNLVRAPGGGYLKEIFVTEGQKVSAGQQLASLVIEHNLVLKADVSPDHIGVLSSITTANFTVGYSDRLYRLSEMNGRKISVGKSTGDNSYYIPLYFRLDHRPELIDGTFAEIYLIGGEIREAVVVPNSALMEEYGKMYVFVAEAGKFIKRYIETGYTDGERTMVYSGLTGNETIVGEGTYRVKLMNTVTTSPAHNH
jgi:membrane fusion protein, heavy metal efflux system